VPLSAFQDQLKFTRFKSVLVLGGCAGLLVIACTVSFGMSPFFTQFLSYGGGVKSFFDLIVDVFYETILPLNGFIVCLFVVYRWKLKSLNAEMSVGDNDFQQSFTQKYLNFSLTTFVPIILFAVFVNTVMLKFVQFDLIAWLFW